MVDLWCLIMFTHPSSFSFKTLRSLYCTDLPWLHSWMSSWLYHSAHPERILLNQPIIVESLWLPVSANYWNCAFWCHSQMFSAHQICNLGTKRLLNRSLHWIIETCFISVYSSRVKGSLCSIRYEQSFWHGRSGPTFWVSVSAKFT